MRADYDSRANAIAIAVGDIPAGARARSDQVHERCNVALVDGVPVDVEVLYPDLGIDQPLEAAAASYDLDLEALKAAARSALAAPDRVVTLDVGIRQ